MSEQNNLRSVASRLKMIRKQQNFNLSQMAEIFEISRSAYSKYERGVNLPSYKIQFILADKFDISLDWLHLNRGPMHFSDNQKVSRENEQQKQELDRLKKELERLNVLIEKQKEKNEENIKEEPAIPPEALIVTAPDIKELFQYMEDNPLFKHQLLTHFYRYKTGKQGAEEKEESPFE